MDLGLKILGIQRSGIHWRPEKNGDKLSEPKYNSNDVPLRKLISMANSLNFSASSVFYHDNAELTKAKQWIGEKLKEHWERIEINPGETAIIGMKMENILRIHGIHHNKYTCI
uniref:Transposase n=1 Tax=Caenorhabditis tropicalis TaxID=1561998 RepID=A0A1I7TGJ8_9PELO